jgi:hypothetical protein
MRTTTSRRRIGSRRPGRGAARHLRCRPAVGSRRLGDLPRPVGPGRHRGGRTRRRSACPPVGSLPRAGRRWGRRRDDARHRYAPRPRHGSHRRHPVENRCPSRAADRRRSNDRPDHRPGRRGSPLRRPGPDDRMTTGVPRRGAGRHADGHRGGDRLDGTCRRGSAPARRRPQPAGAARRPGARHRHRPNGTRHPDPHRHRSGTRHPGQHRHRTGTRRRARRCRRLGRRASGRTRWTRKTTDGSAPHLWEREGLQSSTWSIASDQPTPSWAVHC